VYIYIKDYGTKREKDHERSKKYQNTSPQSFSADKEKRKLCE
jgi:hypothetical protein